ncbi:hypothetical protein ACMFMG_002257 [Clarireedia jacksonii]
MKNENELGRKKSPITSNRMNGIPRNKGRTSGQIFITISFVFFFFLLLLFLPSMEYILHCNSGLELGQSGWEREQDMGRLGIGSDGMGLDDMGWHRIWDLEGLYARGEGEGQGEG